MVVQAVLMRVSATDISLFCPAEPDSLELVRAPLGKLLKVHRNAALVHTRSDET